ncbi:MULTISPECIES: DUF1622 domain-containing protein [unclassified Clostridium]|uniref:DUF1622 domain-containing protein n=1 Tax=unclassified Clostridium TaxID=2614128 RepID=UPI0025C39B92|nr:DUF1622 domain-containing protein [Clostridium sp.]MCI6691758.1 DUF1622 domain-containing protein [Clostridium sp.]MDY2632691.1 DUF1622 domain-containing protein [Clostridium sp.]MDY4251321.1 DUF1622 domain-containing protein [Clostridium sp.]MDY6227137.1 DUF1622 domain-containing protein [Clostridium sp.]
MIEHIVEVIASITIHILELMGIVIIIIGAIKAFYTFILNMITKRNIPVKVELAKSLTLALEFKLGAEILKTVIVRSLDEMYILAAIILLRAILAFVIHWELKSEMENGH